MTHEPIPIRIASQPEGYKIDAADHDDPMYAEALYLNGRHIATTGDIDIEVDEYRVYDEDGTATLRMHNHPTEVMRLVREFRRKHRLTEDDVPSQSWVVGEEYGEFMEALAHNTDKADIGYVIDDPDDEIAEEAADLIYTVVLLCLMAGTNPFPSLYDVARSNLQKDTSRDGVKITKDRDDASHDDPPLAWKYRDRTGGWRYTRDFNDIIEHVTGYTLGEVVKMNDWKALLDDAFRDRAPRAIYSRGDDA